MKLGKPNDTEYIQAFRNNNNDIVTLFYRQYRADFKDFVKAFVKKKIITISICIWKYSNPKL